MCRQASDTPNSAASISKRIIALMNARSCLNACFVDRDAVGHELLPEIGEHVVVDDEVRLDGPASGRLLADARSPSARVLLRVARERLACVQHLREPAGVESAGVARPERPAMRLSGSTPPPLYTGRPDVGVLQFARRCASRSTS